MQGSQMPRLPGYTARKGWNRDCKTDPMASRSGRERQSHSQFSMSRSSTPLSSQRIVPVPGSKIQPKCVHSFMMGYDCTHHLNVCSSTATGSCPSSRFAFLPRLLTRAVHFFCMQSCLSSLSSSAPSIPKMKFVWFWIEAPSEGSVGGKS